MLLRHSLRSIHTSTRHTMRVIPVPCRSDNYEYIIACEDTGKTAVVDPYDPKKLEEAASKEGLKLGDNLLTTHSHHDHAGGNEEFVKGHPGVEVYGGHSKIPSVTKVLKHNDTFNIGTLSVRALFTPCHTQDHICYYVEDKSRSQRAVFTGDTLFVSGCGRFFEGTPEEMNVALNERLASLPDDTVTYVGHEYTKSNVAFSSHVDPSNEDIKKLVKYANENQVTTGKFTIGDEKKFNVFMRLDSTAVKEKTGTDDPVKAMGALREMKNNFKG